MRQQRVMRGKKGTDKNMQYISQHMRPRFSLIFSLLFMKPSDKSTTVLEEPVLLQD